MWINTACWYKFVYGRQVTRALANSSFSLFTARTICEGSKVTAQNNYCTCAEGPGLGSGSGMRQYSCMQRLSLCSWFPTTCSIIVESTIVCICECIVLSALTLYESRVEAVPDLSSPGILLFLCWLHRGWSRIIMRGMATVVGVGMISVQSTLV